jgi:hypothetical protein
MTQEEYKAKIKKLEDDFALAVKLIKKEYAFSNSTIKIGDIVVGNNTVVLVDDIKWTSGYMSQFPHCVYYGEKRKKDGKPSKIKNRDCVYQTSMKQVING